MKRLPVEGSALAFFALSLCTLALLAGRERVPTGLVPATAPTLANARGAAISIPLPCSRCSNIRNEGCPAMPAAPTCWTSFFYAGPNPLTITYQCNPVNGAWGCNAATGWKGCNWGTSWCSWYAGPGECGAPVTITCNTTAPIAGGGSVCTGATTTTVGNPPCENDCS
jgi:hypothetical protein